MHKDPFLSHVDASLVLFFIECSVASAAQCLGGAFRSAREQLDPRSFTWVWLCFTTAGGRLLLVFARFTGSGEVRNKDQPWVDRLPAAMSCWARHSSAVPVQLLLCLLT